MDIQVRGGKTSADRSHQVIFRGVVSLPRSRLSGDDMARLMATPVRSKKAPGKVRPFPVYAIRGDRILIPKFTYLSTFRSKNDVIELEEPETEDSIEWKQFTGALYPNQAAGAEKILKTLGKYRGAIGKGRCGTGKTVVGTYLMSRVPGQCAVLVDQTQIAEQWAQEIRKHLPAASISFIMPMDSQREICRKLGLEPEGRQKIDTKGNVIIAMAQTVMKIDEAVMMPVSFLIVDEAHSFSAPSFAQSIFRFSFKYSLGLTATDERPDFLDWVFKEILGPKIIPLLGKRMDPIVVTVPTELKEAIQLGVHGMFWCNRFRKMSTGWRCQACDQAAARCRDLAAGLLKKDKKIAYHEIWARLSKDLLYNKALIGVIRQLYKHGRNILVLSKFKAHLCFLRNNIVRLGVPESDTSLYFGGMDKDKCLPFPITFATYGIAYKALNAPLKDAEVLAMPVSRVEQPAGRVEREVTGKKVPIIVDFTIRGAPFLMGQYRRRRAFYQKAGYRHVDNISQALHSCGNDREEEGGKTSSQALDSAD